MEIKNEFVLHGMTWAAADKIEYNTIGKFKTSYIIFPGTIFFNVQLMHIHNKKNIHVMH